jgi:rubrerythrin
MAYVHEVVDHATDIEAIVKSTMDIDPATVAFVNQLEQDNEALFSASEDQVAAYYNQITDMQELAKHFTGRMVCERMNMVEFADAIINSPYERDPRDMQLVAKQMMDEANHFRMVVSVVEHLQGKPVDLEAAVTDELTNNYEIKGAKLIQKYDCQNDPVAMALYQFIAEGRAARNWGMMSKVAPDAFVAETYGKIAKDEKFHAAIGKRALMKALKTEEDRQHAAELADQMRQDLFAINCQNTTILESSLAKMKDAYGYEPTTTLQ